MTNKEDFLFGDIQMFLDAKTFPWDNCYPPDGVRNYVQVSRVWGLRTEGGVES